MIGTSVTEELNLLTLKLKFEDDSYIMIHTKNLYHNTSASLYKCFFHEF